VERARIMEDLEYALLDKTPGPSQWVTTSLVLGVGVSVTIAAMFVWFHVLQRSAPPQWNVVGPFVVLAVLVLAFVGAACGAWALVRRHGKRRMAWLGLALNLGTMLFVAGLFVATRR
jgi:hypothetical protein